MNLSSNLVGNINDETTCPHKLLTDTQVSKIYQVLGNGSSDKITFSKRQLFKILQLGWFAIWDVPVFGNFLVNVTKDRIDIAKNYASNFLDKKIDMFNKKHKIGNGTGITLTNNEIK